VDPGDVASRRHERLDALSRLGVGPADGAGYPGGSKGFQIAARPAEDFGPFVQALYERLEKIPAPAIRGEPVQFQIQFRVWGGSGSEQKTQSGSTNDGGPPRP